jgi:hypothetical protein
MRIEIHRSAVTGQDFSFVVFVNNHFIAPLLHMTLFFCKVPVALHLHLHDSSLFEGISSYVNLPITPHIIVSPRKWLRSSHF